MHQDAPTTAPATRGPAGSTGPAGSGPAAGPDRRTLMRMGAAAGLGAAAVAGLAACGSDDGNAAVAPAGSPAAGDAGSAAADGSSPAGDGAPGGALAKLSDVPVGGAYAAAGADGKPIIIAQPKAGQVVAFSAVCTHQGCKVAPDGNRLNCPCHGATYDAFTGKNLSGPAPRPLDPVTVKVNGTDIIAG